MKTLYIKRFATPLGEMIAAAYTEALCLLEFVDNKDVTNILKSFVSDDVKIIEDSNPHIELLQQQLTDYFNTTRKEFSVPLHLVGTEFQKSVWKELISIPFGSTRTYKQQSIALGNLKAIRAVAHANGMNRIAIVVPCHRVIGSSGSLTGYTGGLWRKEFLLNLERGDKQTLLDL